MALENGFASASFSIKTAYYLAKASAAAYLSDFDETVTELGLLAPPTLFTGTELFGFVGGLDLGRIVAFRGTDNVENWLIDGRVVQVPDPAYPGLVHRGFASAMEMLWPGLEANLPAKELGRPLWVTGHSLGALATLAAVRLEAKGYDVRAVYTFGSPRVGDPEFYKGYHPLTYRFVNNNDVVPHVPLETLLLGIPGTGFRHFTYKHVGTPKYLDRHGQIGEGMSDWHAKKEFLLNALLVSGGTPEPEAVADHRIMNYLAALAANL